MDNIGIVVDDLPTTIAFFRELGLESEGVVAEAVESPGRLSEEPELAQRLLDLALQVPTPVWGPDKLGTGETWNSNSTISWLLASSGIDVGTHHASTSGGRAPGSRAGSPVAQGQRQENTQRARVSA